MYTKFRRLRRADSLHFRPFECFHTIGSFLDLLDCITRRTGTHQCRDLISVRESVGNDSVLRIESYSQNCKKSTTSAALGYPDQAGIQRDRWPVLASLSFCCVFYFRMTLYVDFIALWLNEWLVVTGIPLQSVVLKRSVSARRRRKFWAFTGCSGTIPPCQNTNPERFYQGNPKKISQNLVFF